MRRFQIDQQLFEWKIKIEMNPKRDNDTNGYGERGNRSCFPLTIPLEYQIVS